MVWTHILGLLVVLAVSRDLQQPTADEILRRVEQATQGINDYTVRLQATVDMERLQVPAMEATMYFKAPDKIHFESQSFAMLPREGLALNPADLRRKFDAELLGKDTVGGIVCHLLRLRPRSDETAQKSVMLWVDPTRWVVMQMRTQPFEGRRLLARFSYLKVDGRFWLPETLAASFETLGAPAEAGAAAPGGAPEAQQQRRPLRQGSITVIYSNYAVNTGLTDEFFEERKERR